MLAKHTAENRPENMLYLGLYDQSLSWFIIIIEQWWQWTSAFLVLDYSWDLLTITEIEYEYEFMMNIISLIL